MPRPRTPLGAHGKISTRTLPNGTTEAKTWVRGYDGKNRPVTARSTTAPKAITRLREKLTQAQNTNTHSTGQLTPHTRLSALAEHWWEDYRGTGKAPNTLTRYRYTLDRYVLPYCGELTIQESTPGILTARLAAIRTNHGAASAKLARSILSGMFKTAVANDCTHRNPVRDVILPTTGKKPVEALTADQVAQVRAAVTGDVAAVVDLLLATGCRIGEALALRWEDVDLTAGRESVNITGTVITLPGGAVRQPHTKTRDSMRRVFIPGALALQLAHRRAYHLPACASSTGWADEPGALVFPSTTGGPWDPSNFRKRLREQLRTAGVDYPVPPHIFRKTVATLLARSSSLEDASAQLGHSSTDITAAYYIQRLSEAPNNAAVLGAYLV